MISHCLLLSKSLLPIFMDEHENKENSNKNQGRMLVRIRRKLNKNTVVGKCKMHNVFVFFLVYYYFFA